MFSLPLPLLFVCLQDAFVAFHVNKVLVSKYLKSLQIGELAPDQPSIEPTKNVSILVNQIKGRLKGNILRLDLGLHISIAPEQWDPGSSQFFCATN